MQKPENGFIKSLYLEPDLKREESMDRGWEVGMREEKRGTSFQKRQWK